MALGMVDIKIKSRLVAGALSTLLNRIVILPHGVTCHQWGRGRQAPHAFDLNRAGMW